MQLRYRGGLCVVFVVALGGALPCLADEVRLLNDARPTGEKGKTKGDLDELSFKAGMFHSRACDPYGFGDGAYTANASGETMTFEATTVSPTEGKIVWNFTVKGEELNGSFVWYRAPKWYRFFLSNEPVDYWVKAKLKNIEVAARCDRLIHRFGPWPGVQSSARLRPPLHSLPYAIRHTL